MLAVPAHSRVSFGLYEADLESEELYKAGFRVKLQSQPFKVLSALLERPGHLVTREELQLRVWGRDTVVDFDHSLGTAINKIREALSDSADNPRFIETLSKRGYRFIAPVQVLPPPPVVNTPGEAQKQDLSAISLPQQAPLPKADAPLAQPETASLHEGAALAARPLKSTVSKQAHTAVWPWAAVATVACFAVILSGLAYLLGRSSDVVLPPHIAQVTATGNLVPSALTTEDLAAIDTDGVRLFASVLRNGESRLVAVELSGGGQVDIPVPDEVGAPTLSELSPDGSKLLLRSHLSRESEQPLWVVPALGGSALRVGSVLAHDASWMPDGVGILYAAGNELYLTRLSDSPQLYAKLPGRAFWMRWSPDGTLLRFTVIDPLAHTLSLWQLAASDRKPQLLLKGWSQPSEDCCGVWTADGRSFVFQSSRGGASNLWRLPGTATTSPVRLTDGPLQFESPVAARSGGRIYFLGGDARFAMERYNANTRELVPEESWLRDCVRVAYSRDGQWVTWTTADGSLWRSRTDGTKRLQLTSAGLEVFLATWSPDGSQLALMARKPGEAWHIYLVPSAGGRPQLALDDGRNAADPSWGPDGHTLVFGRVNDVMGKEAAARTLMMLDLRSGKVQTVPNSEGLFSPRWSPDGKYIAALSIDGREVRLLNVATQQWSKLPVTSGADPHWSFDGQSLWVHEFADPHQPIVQIAIPSLHIANTVDLVRPEHSGSVVDFTFSGVTPVGDVLVRTRTNTGNLYTLDVNHPASR